MKKSWAVVSLIAVLLGNASAAPESLDKLANDFWRNTRHSQAMM